MPLTSEYLDFLTRYEKFSPKAYWDSIGKVWTIGYGTTRYLNGVPVKEGDVITKPEAINQLKGFYRRFMPTIKQ
jgi:lysozyme